ncbi:peptide ABC transporter substrate-binding protein, partial [Catenibacterium mitsuokai]
MKTVKVLVAASMAAALLAGCGSKTDTDTFRFASELDIQGMDSTVVDDGMSYNAIHAITDGLTAVNDKGKTVPALAKSWDVSADGKTYTFHLKDAKWSNGDKVTANDFVYSWKRIIKNAGNYAYMLGDDGASVKNASQLIDLGPKATDEQMNTLGVKATDDKTLVVELNNKVPYFTDLMAFPCYFPQNEKFVEKCGKN